MEKIKVRVGWCDKNYSCVTECEELNGFVIVAKNTLEELKKGLKESVKLHIEACLKDNDELPDWIVSGQYEFDYIYETSALLHSLDGVLSQSAIARASGIDKKIIGHYASGYRNPRPKQREKIISGIHAISRELAAVS